MANIKVNAPNPLYDGMPMTFKAPCDCTAADGLEVTYGEDTSTFTFRDAHGNNLAGVGNIFMTGAYVKVILDTTDGYAFVQNADTNAYLEQTLAGKAALSAQQTVEATTIPEETYDVDGAELKAFIDALPRLLTKSIVINVIGGDVTEQIELLGFYGSGDLKINGGTFKNRVYINQCSCGHVILSDCVFSITDTSVEDAVKVYASCAVSCDNVHVTGHGSMTAFALSRGCGMFLNDCWAKSCEIGYYCGIGGYMAVHCSTSAIGNANSGNTTGCYVYHGGAILQSGNFPTNGGGSSNAKSGGFIMKAAGTLA